MLREWVLTMKSKILYVVSGIIIGVMSGILFLWPVSNNDVGASFYEDLYRSEPSVERYLKYAQLARDNKEKMDRFFGDASKIPGPGEEPDLVTALVFLGKIDTVIKTTMSINLMRGCKVPDESWFSQGVNIESIADSYDRRKLVKFAADIDSAKKGKKENISLFLPARQTSVSQVIQEEITNIMCGSKLARLEARQKN